jgi:aminoglycoside phosphotransferase (APT) family kinase protein
VSDDEHQIDQALVQGLLDEQFPQWAALELRPVVESGTDNAIYRLGEKLVVRLALRDGPEQPETKVRQWLPRLAPILPLEVPVPVAVGAPGAGYPWFWEIHTWLDGTYAPIDSIDAVDAVEHLGSFIGALWRFDRAGAPLGRGVPLAERDDRFRYWLKRYDGDAAAARAVWDEALAAPAWKGPPLWHHGDLDARNWLVRDGQITAVIDWGCMGVGDPAVDLMVAWKLHSALALDIFRGVVSADDAAWSRARGWVVSQAVAILAYYTEETHPTLRHEAESWLALALDDVA